MEVVIIAPSLKQNNIYMKFINGVNANLDPYASV